MLYTAESARRLRHPGSDLTTFLSFLSPSLVAHIGSANGTPMILDRPHPETGTRWLRGERTRPSPCAPTSQPLFKCIATAKLLEHSAYSSKMLLPSNHHASKQMRRSRCACHGVEDKMPNTNTGPTEENGTAVRWHSTHREIMEYHSKLATRPPAFARVGWWWKH